MFFWFTARRRPKVTKIQKVTGISNYCRTKLLKKSTYKKCSPLTLKVKNDMAGPMYCENSEFNTGDIQLCKTWVEAIGILSV